MGHRTRLIQSYKRVEAGGQHPVQRKEDFKYLQRTIGNQAVVQLLDGMTATEPEGFHTTAAARVRGNGPNERRPLRAGNRGAIIQRRFVGNDREFYGTFLSINWMMLGVTPDEPILQFLNELGRSDQLIAINEGGRLRFDPVSLEITLSKQHLKEMMEYANKRMRGDAITDEEHRTVIGTVANLTHELSHARDTVIVRKEIDDPAIKVMYTELKAWAFEAVTAHQMRSRLSEHLILDREKEQLLVGWMTLEPERIEETFERREDNEFTRRFWDYIVRGVKSKQREELVGFVNVNKEWFVTELRKLKNYVETRVRF